MNKTILSAIAFIMMAFFTAPAFALSADASVSASAGTGSTTASASTQAKIATAISRADQEITRRTTILTQLNTNVQAMVKVSAAEKTSIANEVQTEISSLASLKATIDAETNITDLRTDIQSITKDYRIFMLVMPQGRIEVAADKVETVVSDYSTLSASLQARISAAPSGTNTAQASAWLSDMNTQAANASTQAQAAVSLVANLQPDQGNSTIEASNTAALKSAAADVKVALADLKNARTDAGDIVQAVEAWKTNASASSTVSAQY